jgi:hypothetical protein
MERRVWIEPFDARIVAEGVQLARNEVIGVRDGYGALVLVESGTAWITQESDSRDVLVSAGECFRLDRAGLALLQAHRSATITITAPLVGADPEVFGAAPTPLRRRGHPVMRRMWAIVLRLYRRHSRPRPWEIRLEPARMPASARTSLPVLDPIGPGRRDSRDPAAELRAAIELDMTRCA